MGALSELLDTLSKTGAGKLKEFQLAALLWQTVRGLAFLHKDDIKVVRMKKTKHLVSRPTLNFFLADSQRLEIGQYSAHLNGWYKDCGKGGKKKASFPSSPNHLLRTSVFLFNKRHRGQRLLPW